MESARLWRYCDLRRVMLLLLAAAVTGSNQLQRHYSAAADWDTIEHQDRIKRSSNISSGFSDAFTNTTFHENAQQAPQCFAYIYPGPGENRFLCSRAELITRARTFRTCKTIEGRNVDVIIVKFLYTKSHKV